MQRRLGLACPLSGTHTGCRCLPTRLQSRLTCRSCGAAEGDLSLDGWRSRKSLRWAPGHDAVPVNEQTVAPKPFLAAPLGVDFGQARIGLAVCPGGLMSVPLEILVTRRRPWLDLARELIKTARQHGLDGFVVGLPVTSRGNIHDQNTDSIQGRQCRNFAQTLHAVASHQSLPVYLFDESRTSTEAAAALGLQNTSRLKQQGKLDAVAAALLLTAYYESPEAAVKVKSIKRS